MHSVDVFKTPGIVNAILWRSSSQKAAEAARSENLPDTEKRYMTVGAEDSDAVFGDRPLQDLPKNRNPLDEREG